MTTAARVASGINPTRGASSSMVRSVPAAVTSSASWVRAPASRFTAVWVVPPPPGMAPRNAPPALAKPVASSSRFARGAGSPPWRKARPAATVSVKLIRAMPTAAGQSPWTSDRSGRVRGGRPVGTCPTIFTP